MTKHQIELIENSGNQELRAKKRSLESRLIGYGIKNYQVSHLPYLDCSREKFQSPYDAGCRMMILYAIAYSADNLNERKSLIRWLKDEKIWDKVSLNEKEFLNNKEPIESLCQDLTWRIESALTLGWCLKKIRSLPKLDEDNIESEIEEFQKNVPQLGDSLMPFLTKLEFRDYGEIYEENLVNEMPTTYFRDLIFNGNEDETNIDSQVSFERHNVLNWLRQYAGIEEWDETDTST